MKRTKRVLMSGLLGITIMFAVVGVGAPPASALKQVCSSAYTGYQMKDYVFPVIVDVEASQACASRFGLEAHNTPVAGTGCKRLNNGVTWLDGEPTEKIDAVPIVNTGGAVTEYQMVYQCHIAGDFEVSVNGVVKFTFHFAGTLESVQDWRIAPSPSNPGMPLAETSSSVTCVGLTWCS